MIHINIHKQLHGSIEDMALNVKLDIKTQEFVALTGHSGSGKTTLLRVLAGLDKADGEIVVDGEVWLGKNKSRSVQKRQIGFVFQNYALFANMSVEENLLYIGKDKDLAKSLLDIAGLTSLRERSVELLSGGQKQRVALCRAMMNRPKLLLMDEPLSALDSDMRMRLQEQILDLHHEFGTTTIMVSHDPSEIYRLSKRVIVMEQGRVISDGLPKEILLQTQGSQKFSFEGELLDIIKMDVVYIAIVSIGQQLVEVVISSSEAKTMHIGEKVRVSTKAFTPMISG